MSLIDVDKFSYKYHKLYEKNQEFLKKSKIPEQTKGYLRCMEDTMYLLSNADTVECQRGEWAHNLTLLNTGDIIEPDGHIVGHLYQGLKYDKYNADEVISGKGSDEE